MRQLYHCPRIANDVYTYFDKGVDRRRHGYHPTRQRPLQLFRPEGTLELTAMDILVSLPETKAGNGFILVITGAYSKNDTVGSD